MLRITTSETTHEVVLKLEGKLAGPWVEELERCWRSTSREDKTLQVDISAMTFVDAAGKRLLCVISHDRGKLLGSGLVAKSLIEEICTGKPAENSGKARQKVKEEAGRLLLLLLLPFLLASATRAQDSSPVRLTLRDAVATALKESPQIQIATLSYAESQQDRLIARSALLPQVGLDVLDRAERFNLYADFGSKFPGVPEHAGPFQFFQAGPSATMPIFDLTLWRRWEEAHQGMTASQAQENAVREQVVLLVVSQYLAGMRAVAAVKAAQSRADLAEALYDQANDLQKNGVGTGIDTLRANVELQNEKQRLLEAATQQKVALYGLVRLLNMDPQREIELADTPNFYQTPEINASQNLEQAYEARPEMKELAAQLRRTELAKRAASESRLPTLNFQGNWGEQGLSGPTAIPAYTYQLDLNVPLFTGGRIRADMAKADLDLKKMEQHRVGLRNQIALEVKSSEAQLDAAQHEVDVANQGVKLAQEEVSQSRDRFQAGVANNIEVVTAQDALARANDNQIAALYAYNQARADLSHAIGHIEGLYSK